MNNLKTSLVAFDVAQEVCNLRNSPLFNLTTDVWLLEKPTATGFTAYSAERNYHLHYVVQDSKSMTIVIVESHEEGNTYTFDPLEAGFMQMVVVGHKASNVQTLKFDLSKNEINFDNLNFEIDEWALASMTKAANKVFKSVKEALEFADE